MNWTDHVNDTVRKCKFKLRSLEKLGGVVTEDQRKRLVEGVILSRLHQHLEVVSMGRKGGHGGPTESTESGNDVDWGRREKSLPDKYIARKAGMAGHRTDCRKKPPY